MRFLPPLPSKHKGVVLGGFAVLGVCALFAVFGSRGVVEWRRQLVQQKEFEDLAFRLEQRNRTLRDRFDRLEHDDAYLEKQAREKLGWIKPGELIYRVDRRSDRARD
jgi:cell division protein FtsB